ncbi:uncharacterized protein LOC103309416 [Acyrthosiphon pisum]|uniref:MADF domain-containing protein n=1 Tax=Acyrthosiphon pisum TaxID=7029 RepID=A0A8R2B5X3_ACYPI|nr:uncharacterized protein LOC103309416 [Acyrthosiphon pisum]|eukprot:XP_008182988.1 PREDICTED: uncharacterized protein LOC103309416 [Acyrthosiphon pisum]
MSFDTDFFIISIEQKISIWNTSYTDYRNRDLKLKDWEDIGTTMNLNFKDFTGKQKDDYIKELQKKWKSLRDAFRKEHTKYDRSGSQASKKPKYCYYDALSFLTPTFTVRQTSGNISVFSLENTMDLEDTEDSPDIEIAASNDNPSRDLTAQIDTSMNTPFPTSILGTKKKHQ